MPPVAPSRRRFLAGVAALPLIGATPAFAADQSAPDSRLAVDPRSDRLGARPPAAASERRRPDAGDEPRRGGGRPGDAVRPARRRPDDRRTQPPAVSGAAGPRPLRPHRIVEQRLYGGRLSQRWKRAGPVAQRRPGRSRRPGSGRPDPRDAGAASERAGTRRPGEQSRRPVAGRHRPRRGRRLRPLRRSPGGLYRPYDSRNGPARRADQPLRLRRRGAVRRQADGRRGSGRASQRADRPGQSGPRHAVRATHRRLCLWRGPGRREARYDPHRHHRLVRPEPAGVFRRGRSGFHRGPRPRRQGRRGAGPAAGLSVIPERQAARR
uniref:Twin-arginine translocation signal domain-containing protein n=1 Tax=Parastrongyloides trichosuri TaxID=131310 RepID=A0A0N5A4S1_PARTI